MGPQSSCVNLVKLPTWPYGGGVAQMVERSLSMREVPGSIPGASIKFFYPAHPAYSESSSLKGPPGQDSPASGLYMIELKKIASSGNRTRAARVAGEHSTTEPTMP